MRIKISLSALIVLAVGTLSAQAQGRLHDQITVNLPYQVRIGDKILQPSQYAIRQVSGTVLQIVKSPRDRRNMKVEATVMTLPTEKNKPSKETMVVLNRFGGSYYFDQVWIQGKGTGYKFTMPERVKSLKRERLSARNEQVVLPEIFAYED